MFNETYHALPRYNLSAFFSNLLEDTLNELREQAKQRYIQENLAPFRTEASAQQDPQVQQAQAEVFWQRFFFKHPDVVDSTANRKLLYERAFTLADDGVITVEHLGEAATLLSNNLTRRKVPTAKNLEQDQQTLEQYCRATKRHFNVAALNLLREQFGAEFSSTDIDQALQSRSIALGAATPEELAIWAQEDAEARTEYLLTAPKQVLKQEAKKESEQRRSAAIAEADRQHIEAVVTRDQAFGNYPPLPETWNGETLDANFIKKCSVETHKRLTRQFGSAQLDLRLRGIK